MTLPAVSTVAGRPTAAAVARNPFFLWMATLLLVIVLAGFAPTLYLRALFDPPPIPARIYAHGIILTSWFVWLFVQTVLIRAGRRSDHKKLGIIGVGIAVLTVAVALDATLNAVPRLRATGIDLDADISALGEGIGSGIPIAAIVVPIVWGNLVSALGFLVLVSTAIVLRANTEAHKRLMLLASISILGPAVARVSRWPMLGGEQGPLVRTVLVGLLLVVIVYDLVSRGRLHPATLWGSGFAILCASASRFVAATEFGQAFVRGLE
jgi:hypothetical protein